MGQSHEIFDLSFSLNSSSWFYKSYLRNIFIFLLLVFLSAVLATLRSGNSADLVTTRSQNSAMLVSLRVAFVKKWENDACDAAEVT